MAKTRRVKARGPVALSHVDRKGRAAMVDVGDKPETNREAAARGDMITSRFELTRPDGTVPLELERTSLRLDPEREELTVLRKAAPPSRPITPFPSTGSISSR